MAGERMRRDLGVEVGTLFPNFNAIRLFEDSIAKHSATAQSYTFCFTSGVSQFFTRIENNSHPTRSSKIASISSLRHGTPNNSAPVRSRLLITI